MLFTKKRILFSHLTLCISLGCLFTFPVHALDLSIDLPLNAGKSPVLYTGEGPSPKMPSRMQIKNWEESQPLISPTAKVDTLTLQASPFPELSCLKENIDFWERIYSDIDVNEAIIHDKNNLGRVYEVVTLPKSRILRSAFLRLKKQALSKQLAALAQKVQVSSILTPQDQRVLMLFSKKDRSFAKILAASRNVRVQTGLKSQFQAGVDRSLTYMPIVLPIIKLNGLPTDLAYLPHVESSYNEHAGSKVGAQGLWQLMPSTMSLLEGKTAVYKRTDSRLSTRAAMKLLKQNYAKIGNWPLALTAYNHGANGVLHAMAQTHSRDLCKIIESYNSPSFKFASSNFYAQFIAAKKVAVRKYQRVASSKTAGLFAPPYLSSTGGHPRSNHTLP